MAEVLGQTQKFWDFGKIYHDYTKPSSHAECNAILASVGVEIVSAMFQDITNIVDLLPNSKRGFRYVVRVRDCKPGSGGLITDTSIYIYKDLGETFEAMNRHEYLSDVTVDVFEVSSYGEFIWMYEKLYDDTGYIRFAQVERKKYESEFVLKELWASNAKVYLY